MSITIKHKKSAVASSKPTGAQIDNGEIAINYSDTDPALYIKDSTGAVIRIAGNGAVGGSSSSAVAPTTPADGDTWVDTSAHPPSMKVWDATTSKWEVVGASGSGTAPTSPATGAVWVDTSTVPNVIKVWDGGNWVLQTGATVTASVAPAAPATGQVWVDSSASPSPIKIWDGSSWVTTAATGAASQTLANDAKYATKAEVQAEDLWDRTGTEIHPKTAGDDVFTSGDVKVGGTTAAPTIKLHADGSATFAGTNRAVVYVETASLTGAPSAGDAGTMLQSGTVFATRGGTTNIWEGRTAGSTTVTSSIKPNGSAKFGSYLIADTLTADSGATNNDFYLGQFKNKNGIRCAIKGTGLMLGNGITDINSTSPVGVSTKLLTDGSATFAGDVKIGGTLPASPNIDLKADGSIVALADATIHGLTIGLGKGSITSNTAVGYKVLNKNTTGDQNTAIGESALFNNTKGAQNTAVGLNALHFNTEGKSSIAVGLNALYRNTTGGSNTALGQSALSKNTTGDYNTAVGREAGYYIEGSHNTILGAYKGVAGDATLNNTVIISAGTTERLRIDSTGNVGIGGTLPASPNIKLKADGWVEFAGGITAAGKAKLGGVVGIGGATYVGGDIHLGTLNSSGDYIGNSDRKIVLKATDGSAEFGSLNSSSNSGFGAKLSVDPVNGKSAFQVQQKSGQAVSNLAFGARLGTALNFEVDYGGAIKTAGDVLIGGTLPSAPNIKLTTNGNIRAVGLAAAGRVYADNAAAKAAGRVDGDFYRKADGTLMVVFT